MITDNIKILLLGILGVLLLLSVCIHIDYATNTTINNINNTPMEIHNKSITVVNSTKLNDLNSTGSIIIPKKTDKIYTTKEKKKPKTKKKKPTVSMTGRPSCSRCARNHMPYKWSTHTYLDYCPNCHHYNCLVNKHKSGSVHERELTCKYCDSDYCVVCGKEKYSWSNVYLRRA